MEGVDILRCCVIGVKCCCCCPIGCGYDLQIKEVSDREVSSSPAICGSSLSSPRMAIMVAGRCDRTNGVRCRDLLLLLGVLDGDDNVVLL